MRVLDHQPAWWFLFEESGTLFLDVNCSHGAAGFSCMIALSPEEVEAYAGGGREQLDRLARDIQDSAPALRNRTSRYGSRDVSDLHVETTRDAVSAWRAAGGENEPG
jgi:hypothetical protein